MPLDAIVNIPCAAAGAGETVHLTGAVRIVRAVTYDANGGRHTATHIFLVDVSAIGLTTGQKYQVSQPDSFISNSGSTGGEFTFVNNFLMVAPGPGNNLRAHELGHGVIDANGNLITVIDNIMVDCG